ncbi:MAG TPA: 2-oxoglutarate dehydrogenase E1 component [Candidatus Limnocylindrales bacterium]|nr:2-oxoglutarate dehydrogenase E1 component [Candidatus Limnocylindrales bacterium]
MSLWDAFHGANAGYVQELYERYLRDPESVDTATRAVFVKWAPSLDGPIALPVIVTPATTDAADVRRIVGGVNYAEAIRQFGLFGAQLDPLGAPQIGDPALTPEAHGIHEQDLRGLPASLIGGPIAARASDAFEAVQALKRVYLGRVGFDYEHVREPAEREWLRFTAESRQFDPQVDSIDPVKVLQRLTEVEAFERFIHRIFPGKHRFSIEGLDTMVPILDEIIGGAAETGTRHVLFGMAHRGRLNMLAHLLGKPYASILAEFKDPLQPHKFRGDLGWMGDVKYHMGARRSLQNGREVDVVLSMPPNPSHLEFINPVVAGMARAAGTRADFPGEPSFNPSETLPILIHGDAAFPGQGVVAETFNLSRLPGYWAGGTIHIIANNQLGYTTDPVDSRSTLFASDLAKGFKAPIVHVNADDPEACILAARTAFAFQEQFEHDFVIDLIGYRRYGHNEGDEPGFTQPLLYHTVEQHPTVRALYGQTLVARGILSEGEPDEMLRQQMEKLQGILEGLDPERDLIDQRPTPPAPGTARRVKTSVPAERLREINTALLTLPEGFHLHPKLARVMKRRQEIAEHPLAHSIDWSHAEDLALASILADGIPVRMTGQDVERGTFSQRHAVFHDAETGKPFIPLQKLPQAKAAYEIHNSPLSEQAVMGFEFGYNVQEPSRLVLWEGQYGDFDNGAQVIIDEFVVSARAKWGQTPSLVLLLPHGHEGAGPDHSSARPERFLQMAADTNMRVAFPTTAAQYFHLLRRQALTLKTDPLPLVVLTPKSLLRNPIVSSSLHDLTDGRWQPVIDDVQARAKPEAVRRMLLVSGKVYVDLATAEQRRDRNDVAIVRIEQLYPFPADDLRKILDGYPALSEVVWLQEEPENMGALDFVRPLLVRLIVNRAPLRFVARPRSSSPSEGTAAYHALSQAQLVEKAFSPLAQETSPVEREGQT